MAQLITENCFKIIKKEPLWELDEPIVLPSNWINELCLKLNQLSLVPFYPPFGDWIAQKCFNLPENHKLKIHLLKFYRAITQNLFPDYILDMTFSLLNDWNNECIEGLINIIESSFYFCILKQNLFEFLQSIRMEIIELTFNHSQTDNNHTRNRIYTVASLSGYGIDAINSNDQYPGILSDQHIQKMLSDAFKKYYSPLEILYKIVEKIKADATHKYNYHKGQKLSSKNAQDFLFSIQVFFNDKINLNTYAFCIYDTVTYEYLDYNWGYINLYIFKKLLDLEVFQIKTDNRLLIESFLEARKEIEPDDIPLLFEQDLISTPIQLSHFFELMDTKTFYLKRIMVFHYINHLISNKHPELFKALSIYSDYDGLYEKLMDNPPLTIASILEQLKFTNPLVIEEVDSFFKKCPEDFLKNLFLYKDEQEKNILILAAVNHPNLLNLILQQLKKLDLIEIVITHLDQAGNNVLNALLNHHYSYAEQLLKFLVCINTSPDIIMKLLEAKNILKQNSLMVCINQHPSLLRYMLNLIETLSIENKRKLKLFTQINNEGDNALMLALNEHVSLFQAILITLGKLKVSAANFHQLLTQKNQLQQNVLFNAAGFGEVYFLALLKNINILNFNVSEKISLLTTISFGTRNCLFHFNMNQNQLDQKELTILNLASGKIFFNGVYSQISSLSHELQKAFIEILIELQLECINMSIEAQRFNPASSKPTSEVKFYTYLSMLNISFKRSNKTDQELFKFSKKAYDTIMDNTYFEIPSNRCCFSFFHKPNEYEEIVNNLKQLLDLNMRLVEPNIHKNMINLV